MINSINTLNKYSSYSAPAASLAITAAISNGQPDPITAFTSIAFDKLSNMLFEKATKNKEKLNSVTAALAGIGGVTALNHLIPSLKSSPGLNYIANFGVFAGTYKALQTLAPTTDILSTVRFPATLGLSLIAGHSANTLLTSAFGKERTNLIGVALTGGAMLGTAFNDLIFSKVRILETGSIVWLNK